MKLKSLIDFKRCREMSREETGDFLRCSMADMKVPDKEINFADDESAPFTARVIDSRLRHHGLRDKVSSWVVLFLSTISDRPGTAVLWVYTLAHMLEKGTGVRVGMHELALEFPTGFPVEEAIHECWEAQKGRAMGLPYDNCVDHEEFWPKLEAIEIKSATAVE